MRRRPNTWVIALVLGVAVVAAIVAFIAIPSGHPASSASSSSAASSPAGVRVTMPSPKPSNSPSASLPRPRSSLADDFSTNKVGWVDDAHASAGAYTAAARNRLSVTGYNGQNELARAVQRRARPQRRDPLNLDASVDVRTLSGAAQGYGLGLAFRGDGNGDLYAFSSRTTPWPSRSGWAPGPRLPANPAPVSVSDLHVGSSG